LAVGEIDLRAAGHAAAGRESLKEDGGMTGRVRTGPNRATKASPARARVRNLKKISRRGAETPGKRMQVSLWVLSLPKGGRIVRERFWSFCRAPSRFDRELTAERSRL
jgi:hypothetical protein